MLVLCCLILITHTVCGQTVIVLAGDTAVIPCRISETFTYPRWTGPPNSSTYTYDGNPTINQTIANSDRLAYNTDQRSINIANTSTSDAGVFTCTKTVNDALLTESVALEVRVTPSAPRFGASGFGIGQGLLRLSLGQPGTLSCISMGSYPLSTVKLYRTSVSGSPVNTTYYSSYDRSGIWTVYLYYNITPVESLHGLNYICVSAFTTAPLAQQQSTIQLFVNLKPSTPSISLVGTPVSGQVSQTIARCFTSGFRPASSISMTITFRGDTRTFKTVVGPSSNDTYSVIGDYSKAVDKTDNGQNLTCSVSHNWSLQSSVLSSSTIIRVQFAPNSATLSLQPNVVAEDTSTVLATCTSGFSNPAATITWRVDGTIVTSSLSSTTANNVDGIATTQQLQIVATRNMHDKSIVCYVSNTINTQTPLASTQQTLNLKFAPNSATLSLQPNVVAEDTSTVLATCTSGFSNPEATITWRVDGTIVTSSLSSTTANNVDGIATTQQLQIVATRNMHDKSIVCYVSNTVNTQTPVASEQKTLNLKFHPIAIITGPSSPITEGQPSGPLTCTVSSNPVSTSISWYYGDTTIPSNRVTVTDNVATYTIPSVNRTHAGNYKCTAINGYNPTGQDTISLAILFAPRTISVSDNTNVVVDGTNTVRITCATGEANPQPDITWRRNSSPIMSSSNIVFQDGHYGGKTSTQVLEFLPTRDDQSVTCRASNSINTNSPVSDTIILDTKYPPLITTTPTSTVTKIEGSGNQLLICSVSSRPLSTIRWYKDGQVIETGDGNTANNTLDYTISHIDRDKAGEYTCEANNNIGIRDVAVQVIVYYAPDVTVTTTNTTESAASVDVVCQPSGVPATYDITQWTQTWTDGTIINSNLPLQQTLTLTDVSYQHSGLYTCTASNGITASNNPNAGVGGAYLLVKLEYNALLRSCMMY